ncbi:3',5'-cyclic-nucleotide phosphodiesterase [Uliginosibacterium gangwonense]|uniref:3',5'-cyclic-nucleotide phosphodiesterase n=1 Tax=Uliginosibacterium gangwonense TaxID=392736 RepID=UPI0003770044|nr:3',5'-cyclic-nucleotide phosphodiesterase [Uliginosibacterium gangwonense]
MKIRVLGCSGGVGGPDRHTTALAVDDDILIDCGTGVGALSIEEMLAIDHIFLTHAHFDHVALLPMLIDSVAERRSRPVSVYALPETLAALHAHVFNWVLWPDFTVLPEALNPVLKLQPLRVGELFSFGGRQIQVLPAAHSVPAVGYCMAQNGSSLAFSGDTTLCEELLDALNAMPALRYLLIETAFPEAMHAKAEISRHLCPSKLGEFLSRLKTSPEVFITHLKPLCEVQASREISMLESVLPIQMLLAGEVFEV